jgi:hypothetical protein
VGENGADLDGAWRRYAERINEWAYARPYRSEPARTRALDKCSTCTTVTGITQPLAARPSVA